MNQGEFIKDVQSWETGGGCIVDFVMLKNGMVVGINEECVCVYGSIEDFYSGAGTHMECIDIMKPEWNNNE